MNMQRCGEDEILAAIDNNENISLILVKRDSETTKLQNILEYAESSGIKIILAPRMTFGGCHVIIAREFRMYLL